MPKATKKTDRPSEKDSDETKKQPAKVPPSKIPQICGECGKVLAHHAGLRRHLATLHGIDEAGQPVTEAEIRR